MKRNRLLELQIKWQNRKHTGKDRVLDTRYLLMFMIINNESKDCIPQYIKYKYEK